MQSSKSKKWKRRTIAFTTSLFVVFSLAELGIRLGLPHERFLDRNSDCFWVMRTQTRRELPKRRRFKNVAIDEELGWTMAPDYSRGSESTNSRGHRGPELEFERPQGPDRPPRIVVLGDSFTFGLGVADESTYCARLAARVPGLEVLNMGVNGYGTDQQYLYWNRDGVRYSPDAVLIGIYTPDFHRNALRIRELYKPRFVVEGDRLVLPEREMVGPRLVLEAHGEECRSPLRLLDVAGYVRRWFTSTEADETFNEKAFLMRGILELLRDSTAERNIELGIVIIPNEKSREYQDHRRIEEVIENAARALDVPCLNLTDPLIEWAAEHSGETLYDSTHGHWTEVGHEVAAERIAQFIEANDLLQKPAD